MTFKLQKYGLSSISTIFSHSIHCNRRYGLKNQRYLSQIIDKSRSSLTLEKNEGSNNDDNTNRNQQISSTNRNEPQHKNNNRKSKTSNRIIAVQPAYLKKGITAPGKLKHHLIIAENSNWVGISGFTKFCDRSDLAFIIEKFRPTVIDPLLEIPNFEPTGRYYLEFSSKESRDEFIDYIENSYTGKYVIQKSLDMKRFQRSSLEDISDCTVRVTLQRTWPLPLPSIQYVYYWFEDYEVKNIKVLDEFIYVTFTCREEAERFMIEKDFTLHRKPVRLLHYRA